LCVTAELVSVSFPAPFTRIPHPPSLDTSVSMPPLTVTRSSVRSPVVSTSKRRYSVAPVRRTVAPLPWIVILLETTGRPFCPLFAAVTS
jgi:hypothetical protein